MQNNNMETKIEIEKIIRSKRKTIALQITDDATLIVRAPFGVSEQIIKNIVAKHAHWIRKKREEILSRDPKFVKKEFVNGEGFLYLGKYYKLTIVERQDEPLVFKNGFFLSKAYLPIAREVFVNWYKKKAMKKFLKGLNGMLKREDSNTIKLTSQMHKKDGVPVLLKGT